MIRYSHAMTCLMAYHNEKSTETISIMLQATFGDIVNKANDYVSLLTVINLPLLKSDED